MPSNFAKTGLLLVMLTVIFVGMGALIGGTQGMVIAFIIALAMNIFSFWNSDTVVLRMFNAQEVSPDEAPELYDMVAQLAERAQLPMPRVYILHSPQPNAFATGRSPERSAVAVSTGLIETLSTHELAGVVAHELAHISNRDTLIMTVAATIAGAISMLANILQFSLLFGRDRPSGPLGWVGALAAILIAPFAAMLVQMAISRSREYEADRIGAAICGNPLWLADALRKIQSAAHHIVYEEAERVPAAAHMFIINPLTGRGFDSWFTTHPNTENRIAELELLAQQWGPLNQPAGRAEPHADDVGGPWSRSSGTRTPPSGPWGRPRGPWG